MNHRLLAPLVLLVTLAFTATVALAAEPELPRHLQQALWEAQQALDAKQPAKALDILAAEDAQHPGAQPPLFHLMRGNILYEQNRLSEAREAFARGHREHPRDAGLATNLALCEYQLQHYARAGELFGQAYDLGETKSPELLYQSAAALFQADDFTGAHAALRRLLDAGGTVKTDWLTLLVQTCVRLSRWKEAEETLLRFLTRTPADLAYWKLLAQVRFQREDYRGAAAAMEVVTRLGNPTAKDWRDLADLHQYLGVPLKAAQDLEQALGPHPTAEEFTRLARLYAQALRHDQALDRIGRALRLAPTAELYREQAEYLRQALRPEQALEALDQALRLAPHDPETLLRKAFLAWDLARWDLARQTLNQALRLPASRQRARQALDVLQEIDLE